MAKECTEFCVWKRQGEERVSRSIRFHFNQMTYDDYPHTQESPHYRALKFPKSLQRVFPGRCQKVVDNVPGHWFWHLFDSFSDPFGPFQHFFDTPGREAREDLFQTFWESSGQSTSGLRYMAVPILKNDRFSQISSNSGFRLPFSPASSVKFSIDMYMNGILSEITCLYVVELLSGPSLAFSGVIIRSKFAFSKTLSHNTIKQGYSTFLQIKSSAEKIRGYYLVQVGNFLWKAKLGPDNNPYLDQIRTPQNGLFFALKTCWNTYFTVLFEHQLKFVQKLAAKRTITFHILQNIGYLKHVLLQPPPSWSEIGVFWWKEKYWCWTKTQLKIRKEDKEKGFERHSKTGNQKQKGLMKHNFLIQYFDILFMKEKQRNKANKQQDKNKEAK